MRLAGAGLLTASGALRALPAFASGPSTADRRVLVLGIDGMSPVLLQRYVDEGRMPNFAGLISRGSFLPLRSSIPPQSPVAWSNFITGMNPGQHGIYDFIHREPATMRPYLSTSRSFPATVKLPVGGWRLPLKGGHVALLRKGPAFWKILSDAGVPCTLFRVPANFPPVECEARTLCGMGTPDMLGSYGVCSYVTDVPPDDPARITDAHVTVVDMSEHTCTAELVGPDNTLRKDGPPVKVEFTVWRDPTHRVARIRVQEAEFLLEQGEWSDWVQVEFPMMPLLKSASGICRFFMKQVHPHFELYVSPINIDPSEPALPIATPPDFSQQMVEDLGLFYTEGFAEDTKALSSGILSDADYLEQAMYVFDERLRAFDYFLERFRRGLLFFYLSTIDLNSHMFWRTMDPRHPLYTPELGAQFGKTLEDLYVRMDAVLGQALEHVDDKTTLIVMSDHGFSPFYRTFGVNAWLLENGFARLRDAGRRGEDKVFANTDWGHTYAYSLGINSVYLNLRGREQNGVVGMGRQANALVDELVEKLEAVKDPATGQKVISRVYKGPEVYRGQAAEEAPDLVLGFNRGYRASWGTVLGTYEQEVLGDNDDPWSGDHCMDVAGLSGVLVTNREVTVEDPALIDMAPTVLAEYGFPAPPGTEGRAILRKS